MNQRDRLLISAAALLGCATPALAQLRCDCTQVVDSCVADVAVVGSTVQISSDHRQCSRVDYFIDGQPLVSVAVDGEARESRPPSIGAPRVLVQSCQVCADNSIGPAAATARLPAASAAAEPQPPKESGELEALIQVQPAYPPAALSRGLQGEVELEFTVNAQGHVQSATVTESEPGTVFDAAALAAIGRWRYPAEPGREPVKLRERFEFRPPPALTPAAGRNALSGDTAPLTNGARNGCVRQGPAFDYGDAVEVVLQSTCADPILVFSCAVGTGRYLGRWLCTDSAAQQSLLVRPGDARIGSSVSVTTQDGEKTLSYADRFFVSRAPNSEYWWLACGTDDAECRESARLWVRSVDRQVASLDPQGRSALGVARSH